MTIYVGNLAFQATETDLHDTFGSYGRVKRVVIPTDRDTGRVRGFAFIELDSPQAEEEVINALNGSSWMGRELHLDKANPRATTH